MDADSIVVGAGLAGLAAATELADAGRRVIVLDQEPAQSMGGQAFWSFGGLFLVDSREQRRLGVRDSHELALRDWLAAAAFDRDEDQWARRWAEAYVAFAAGEKRAWLNRMGVRFFPIVGWAERAWNSVPRFHIVWGTGPGVLDPFVRRTHEGARKGLITLRFRHRVTALTTTNGVVDGVHGELLDPSTAHRGKPSSRQVVGQFMLTAPTVIVTSGGIGANHELVRRYWPARLGPAPDRMLSGVPDYVDGSMLALAADAGARVINRDRMWHYVEGLHNWNPIWTNHGIRILPGPSSLWLDARGARLPPPLFPGFDTLGTLQHLGTTGANYSWFVLNQRIIEREFALSGSEQNPDLTSKSWRRVLGRAFGGAPKPVAAFLRHGVDFIVERQLDDLVRRMNALVSGEPMDAAAVRRALADRDRAIDDLQHTDPQVEAIRAARRYFGDRRLRTASPHAILDPRAGPLIAVRLNILTRKTLGGIETDLSSRALGANGSPVPGLYAAGEVAGFGGGGMHGYRALEGGFLGGCLFSGRVAGRAAAGAV
jgi:predicted oxidoreductase